MMKNTLTDFEIGFYEGVIRQSPNYRDALMLLAEAYTRKGIFDKGLALDKRLAELCKNDPVVHYNLACSYALMNKKDEAFKSLERAIELGYGDMVHLKKDSDLKNLHDDPRFATLIDKFLTS